MPLQLPVLQLGAAGLLLSHLPFHTPKPCSWWHRWDEVGFQVLPVPGKAAGSSTDQHPPLPVGPSLLKCFGPEAEKTQL